MIIDNPPIHRKNDELSQLIGSRSSFVHFQLNYSQFLSQAFDTVRHLTAPFVSN